MAKTPRTTDPQTPTDPPRDAPDPRFTLPLKDGKIDLASMRDNRKDALRALLADPDVFRQLGITQPAAARAAAPETVMEFPVVVFDALGKIEAMLATRILAVPREHYDLALATFAFTAEEKKALAEPAGRVLNKYAATAFTKYGDELTLLVALGVGFTNKLDALKSAIAAHVPKTE